MITVRQNDTIQKKTRNKPRSKINIKHWIIRAVYKALYNSVLLTDNVIFKLGSIICITFHMDR